LFVCHIWISQNPLLLYVLFIPLESPPWVGWIDMVWQCLDSLDLCCKLFLNVEQFYSWKFNKIKSKILKGNWTALLVCWKSLNEWDFMKVIS
jgi:hypothetical protein